MNKRRAVSREQAESKHLKGGGAPDNLDVAFPISRQKTRAFPFRPPRSSRHRRRRRRRRRRPRCSLRQVEIAFGGAYERLVKDNQGLKDKLKQLDSELQVAWCNVI